MTDARASDIEERIKHLHIEGSEGEHHLDFEKSPEGWIRLEQMTEEAGYLVAELSRTTVVSLSREVQDHAATYLTTTEVQVTGVSPAELLTWLRPLLNEGQDCVSINGTEFELYPEDDLAE